MGALQGSPAGVNSHAESSSPHVPTEGMEWVELLVREMSNASDMDDARARATRALEAFEKAVTSRSTSILQKVGVQASRLQQLNSFRHQWVRQLCLPFLRLAAVCCMDSQTGGSIWQT